MFISAVDYDKEQIDRAVTVVREKFPNDVERIAYSVREDWADDPALFFRVLLKDREGTLSQFRPPSRLDDVLSLCSSIMIDLRSAVRAYRLQPYFAFRWVSEQERLRDPEWN